MLTNESKNFLAKLRTDLVVSGKKEEDINSILDELETHLIEAENEGKTLKDVIGDQPHPIIKEIKSQVKTAKKEVLINISLSFALIINFLVFFSALRGSFELSLLNISIMAVIGILTFFVYTLCMYKASHLLIIKKSKYFVVYSISLLIMMIITVTSLFFLANTISTPIYQASSVQNVFIIIATLVVFVFINLYFKSKTLFVILFLISIAPVLVLYAPKLREPIDAHPILILIPLGIGCLALFSFIIWCAVDKRFEGTFLRKLIDKLSQ
ncbi:DUF1129 family protein [Bacillus sp. A116_S68]|nr:DUF1129 family protein [Bacillus sp. A116_S68]